MTLMTDRTKEKMDTIIVPIITAILKKKQELLSSANAADVGQVLGLLKKYFVIFLFPFKKFYKS